MSNDFTQHLISAKLVQKKVSESGKEFFSINLGYDKIGEEKISRGSIILPPTLVKEKITIGAFEISLPPVGKETLNTTTNEMEKPWSSFSASIFFPASEEQKAAGASGHYENRVYSRDQIETIFSEMNKFQQEKLENRQDNEKTLDSKSR